MLFSDKQFMVLAGVVVVGGFLLTRKAGEVAEAINPANQDNVINRVFTDSVRSATGNDDWTLGGSIYDGVDSIRGIWGDSDDDRLRQAEEAARLEFQKLRGMN